MMRVILLASLLLLCGAAQAEELDPTPSGFVSCAARHEPGCDVTPSATAAIAETPGTMDLIDRANREVNAAITPMEDAYQYGRVEYWTYPWSGMGDCEDIAIAKKAALEKAGIPSGALRLAQVAIVRGGAGGHVVLLVVTNKETLILDSLPKHADELRSLDNADDYLFETGQDQNGEWHFMTPPNT